MEKTFEELIDEKYAGSNMMLFSKDTLIKFMQQVREATIAECWDIVSRVAGFVDGYEFSQDFNDIKKDSIQIEEYTFNPEEDENLPF